MFTLEDVLNVRRAYRGIYERAVEWLTAHFVAVWYSQKYRQYEREQLNKSLSAVTGSQ